jgi:hypothetical protein
MKRFPIIFLPAIILLAFFSCEEGADLILPPDIDFNTTLVETLPVSVTSTSEMSTSVILDATGDPEILKYVDKIKSYEVTELLFAIENYNAPTSAEIYFNGSVGFSSQAESQPTSSCSISQYNITHFAGTGDFVISTCKDTVTDAIAEAFTANDGMKIYMTGVFTGAPLDFDLKVTVKVKVTASPL